MNLENRNPKKEALTFEKLKAFKGFESFSEEQAQEIILEVRKVSNILLEILTNRREAI